MSGAGGPAESLADVEPGARPSGAGSTLNPAREVRLAVVMYGGSSLAIYINGVAQELLHLVRATAPSTSSPGESTPLRADHELRDTERVYRRLAQLLEGESVAERFPAFASEDPDADPFADAPAEIPARFLVDIISGSSAGGINGIFLAKALATNRDLEGLKQLWVTEGDIGLLINDKASAAGLPGVRAEDPPTSLLNGHRMYRKLLEAFEGMDPPSPSAPVAPADEEPVTSPMVDQLDLFVTATDLSGLVLPIELADKVIGEPRHRNVFHFVYASERTSGDDRNDFVPAFNPFLAFAARCTSSLPGVFQPMTLESADPIVRTFPRFQGDPQALSGSDRWRRFISDYVRVDPEGNERSDFPVRAFGDGGSLDNAPFSYATDRLFLRRADVPVDRKLLYVEPDPAVYAFGQPPDPPPDAIANALRQLVLLPRTETIRDDLQRVLDRNRQTERLRRVLAPLDEDVRALQAAGDGQVRMRDEDVRGRYLEELIAAYGVAYGTYQRLRVEEVTDDLTRLLCRLIGLNEESDDFVGVRYLVSAWRDRHFAHFRREAEASPAPDGQPREAFSALLLDLDTRFEHRRLRRLVEETDVLGRPSGASELARELPAPAEGLVEAIVREALSVRRSANDALVRIRGLGRRLRSRAGTPSPPSREGTGDSPRAENPAHAEVVVRALPGRLLETFADRFRGEIDAGTLQGREGEPTEETVARWTRALRPALARFLAGLPSDDERRRVAEAVEQAIDADLEAVIAAVRGEVRDGLLSARTGLAAALSPVGRDPVRSMTRERLRRAYEDFAYQDVLAYPIRYGTDFGEADAVEVYRVSPKDATALIDPSREPPRKKVSGAQFMHFGAFFDRLWRENDILWGRLDAAERLIEALVPPGEHRSENVRIFRDRAFGEILWAELTETNRAELAGLMATALAQLPAEERSTHALLAFVEGQLGGPLEPRLKDVLTAVIRRRGDLVDYYRSSFELDARLKPAPAIRNAARAMHVLGDVLKGIAGQKGAAPAVAPAAWVSRIGRLMTGVVEVATPGSPAHLLYRHWLVLAYLIEVVLIVVGGLLGQPPATHLGWVLLWFTLGASLAVAAFSDLLRGRTLWKAVLRVVLALIVLGLLAMIGLEIRHVSADLAIRKDALAVPPELPLQGRAAERPWRYVGLALVIAAAAGVVIGLQGRSLRRPRRRSRDPAARVLGSVRPVVRGIVDLELAGTRDRVAEVVAAWGRAGVRSARLNLALDLPFAVVYSTALFLGVAWSVLQWEGVWPFLAWAGWFLAYGQLLAGALDIAEDVCLLLILARGDPGTVLPSVARRAAQVKFLLVGLGIVYVLAGLVRHLIAA